MDKAKQMQFLFEEGGIADDGMNRDPISGNEIPPGSLAEEVRDDIPAQLSEGEYVVPADVLRYYGVKFFEDLRTQAKMGLGEMEEDGRIGGEPIPADQVIDSQLSPEEEAELQAMMGMNEGGLATVATNEDGTQVQFDPMQFPAGFSFARPAPRPESTAVTLYGPNGEIVSLVLPAEQARYAELVGQGYTTQQAPTAVAPEGIAQISDGGGGGGGSDFTTFSGGQPRDLSELSVEELQSNLSGLGTMGKIGGALAIAVNPLFGLAARAALNASRANIIAELEARGEDMSAYREENGRDIYGGGLSLYDGLQDQPGSRSGVDFGDTWLGDALGFDGKAGVQGPGLKESRAGARRSFDGGSTPPASTGGSRTTTTAGSSDSGSDRAPASSPAPSRSPRGDSAADVAADDRSRQTASQASAQRAADRQGTSLATGGRAEGGFVSRRNKNKK
jgi:hypothetical protein